MKTTELKVEYVPIDKIKPYENNAKLHPDWQIDQIVKSIEKFGNCDPIGVWTNEAGELEIVEGHGRLAALQKLNVDKVPVIYLDHLSDEQRKAYGLVHNQTTMNTTWEFDTLENELKSITFDMGDFGFKNKFNKTPEIKNSSTEIDIEEFSDDKFDHKCPRCGFKFNE